MKQFNLDQIKQFIAQQSPETKIYLGADSERVSRHGTWIAEYYVTVVVHLEGKHGCKIFGYVEQERDYDQRKDKPALRLMGEVYRVAQLFNELSDVLQDRYVEVHLDINPDDRYASSQVISQAIGYIRGTCNIEAQVKPQAFAASYAADRLKFILSN
jgi:predicted RNase H-related nuclease YkuK (DUF458 family)